MYKNEMLNFSDADFVRKTFSIPNPPSPPALSPPPPPPKKNQTFLRYSSSVPTYPLPTSPTSLRYASLRQPPNPPITQQKSPFPRFALLGSGKKGERGEGGRNKKWKMRNDEEMENDENNKNPIPRGAPLTTHSPLRKAISSIHILSLSPSPSPSLPSFYPNSLPTYSLRPYSLISSLPSHSSLQIADKSQERKRKFPTSILSIPINHKKEKKKKIPCPHPKKLTIRNKHLPWTFPPPKKSLKFKHTHTKRNQKGKKKSLGTYS